MGCLWVDYGLSINVYELFMGFLWVVYVLSMSCLWVSYGSVYGLSMGCQTNVKSHDPKDFEIKKLVLGCNSVPSKN